MRTVSRANARAAALAERIQERISSRLAGRVRALRVTVDRGVVRLCGECSTFYSKQLAQHAASGAIEDESIDNRIEVRTPSR
ncbi:MAG: BON domain-containing protein [Planctomycetota bacterium]